MKSKTSQLSQASSFSNGRSSPKSATLFGRLDLLQEQVSEIESRLKYLGEEASSVRAQKQNVARYLDKKSEENKSRLMGQLSKFEEEVRKKIEFAKKETGRIDEKIIQLKEAQIISLQLLLAVQRKVNQLQIHLGESDQA